MLARPMTWPPAGSAQNNNPCDERTGSRRELNDLPQHGDDAMERLGRGLLVVHHGDADVVRARIAAIVLLTRRVAARQHPDAGFAPQPCRHHLAAAEGGHIEPQEEAASRPAVAVA